MDFQRPILSLLLQHLSEPRRFIQVLFGPRQTGKTTLARQVMDRWQGVVHYASADEPVLKDPIWIDQQWDAIRFRLRVAGSDARGLLVLDEVQKIPGWAERVKHFWDEDAATKTRVYALLLGSSPMLVQHGLTESLAGRFELIPVAHWSFSEMRDAFDWSIDQYLFFGGYPGAAPLVNDEKRWSRYINDSLIETTISRDIFLTTRVDKPALFRRLFELGCSYSGQVLSYQKMLGQLVDAGNTTTLAHYLSLLQSAGMVAGLSKYSGHKVRQRASSPKLLVLNTALFSAGSRLRFKEARLDTEFWGRLTESAVGASLANGIYGTDIELYYWLDRNMEVDFILRCGKKLTAIEVKSGRRRTALPGMAAFARNFKVTQKLLVGTGGIPIDEFLAAPVSAWVD